MPAPLLNDYKAAFAARRFVATLSGGPSLPPPGSPAPHAALVVLFGCVLLAAPAIGGALVPTLAGTSACALGSSANFAYGAAVAAWNILVHAIHLFYNESTLTADLRDLEHDAYYTIGSDEEPELMGPPISSAFDYVLNQSRVKPAIDKLKPIRLVKAAVAGVVSSVVLAFLSPDLGTLRFGEGAGATTAYALSWIAWCMAHWPLVGPKPSEPNTYFTEDRYHIDDFSRTVHVCIILALWGLETPAIYIDVFDQALGISFAVLPLAWAVGLLPSARICIAKIIELAHTLLLGGTALVNTDRTIVTLACFITPTVISTAYLASVGLYYTALVVAAGGGCLSGSRIWTDLITWMCTSRTASAMSLSLSNNKSSSSCLSHSAVYEIVYTIIRSFLAIGLSLLVILADPTLISYTLSFDNIFVYMVAAIAITIKATCELQQVFMPSIIPVILNPLRAFKSCAWVLSLLSVIHMAAYQLAPYAAIGWIATGHVYQTRSNTPSAWVLTSTSSVLSGVWSAVMLSRCLVAVWIHAEETITDICLVVLIAVCLGTGTGAVCSTWTRSSLSWAALQWCNIDLFTRLFFVGLAKNALVRMYTKLCFWVQGVKHFLFNRKQRHQNWIMLLIPILLISPLSIIVGGILDLPSLAFLGLPLLLLGFPRTARLWPSIYKEYSSGEDAKIYAAMAPSLLKSISSAVASGRIPPIRPGDVLVARIESRLLLLRGVETWFEGPTVIVSGAELEPTSCHALEGTEIDGILERVLEPDSTQSRPWINPAVFHTLLPVGTAYATSYVESKSTTTGILDSPQTLQELPPALFKSLVFCLLRTPDLEEIVTFRDAPIQRAIQQTIWKRFPTKWYDRLKSSTGSQTYQRLVQARNGESASQRRELFDQTFLSLCSSCYAILLGLNPTNAETHTVIPTSLFDMYLGDLPYSATSETRSWWTHSLRTPLRRICIQAFRYAVKLVYDEAVQGDSLSSMADLEDQMDEMVRDWVVTVHPAQAARGDPTHPSDQWRAGLDAGVNHLFALGKQSKSRTGGGMASPELSIRYLSKHDGCLVRLGRINGEAVKGIWSNLVFELLYLTNDDDERYSIQAHELLLRNIIVQSAPPPFGYPIWYSPARLSLMPTMSSLQWGRSSDKSRRTVHPTKTLQQPQSTATAFHRADNASMGNNHNAYKPAYVAASGAQYGRVYPELPHTRF